MFDDKGWILLVRDKGLSGYRVWTWSRYVQYNEIKKHGAVQDKKNLLQATADQSDKIKQALLLSGMEERNDLIELE